MLQFKPDEMYRKLDIELTDDEMNGIISDLAPVNRLIQNHIELKEYLPCHIPGSGCIMVTLGNFTDPEALYANSEERFRKLEHKFFEYPEYWTTLQWAGEEPIFSLVPKKYHGPFTNIERLQRRLQAYFPGKILGGPGNLNDTFISCNRPSFAWGMHVDGAKLRVHVPIRTSDRNFFVWGERDSTFENCHTKMTMQSKSIYCVRTDVPHTVINFDCFDRLHLILDVLDESG